jgi:ubiquinone/menaquinone biosynthesis C-methylase UbiE
MQKITDPQYLTQDQYKDSSNLEARIEIHKRFSTNPQGWFNWVFDTLDQFPKNARVLELGCGAGTIWKECADRISAGWVITLSDLSDGMLDSAWRNLVVTGHNFKFEKIDAQAIPYADQTFDIVIANHIMYHVPDRRQALSEIRRVLKDDGCLIATTVGENHLHEMDAWMKVASKGRHEKFTAPFTLENGKAQIAEFFPKVEMSRYGDNLKIAEVEPLIAYIRSSLRAEDLVQDDLKKIEDELSALLAKDGKIFITKDSGLFKAFNNAFLPQSAQSSQRF